MGFQVYLVTVLAAGQVFRVGLVFPASVDGLVLVASQVSQAYQVGLVQVYLDGVAGLELVELLVLQARREILVILAQRVTRVHLVGQVYQVGVA